MCYDGYYSVTEGKVQQLATNVYLRPFPKCRLLSSAMHPVLSLIKQRVKLAIFNGPFHFPLSIFMILNIILIKF